MSNVIDEIQRDEVAEIAVRIKDERAKRGWTLDELAVRSGLSKSYLSRLEDGDRQPSIASMLSLSKAYGMSLGSLFRREVETTAYQIVRAGTTPVQQGNGIVYQVLADSGRSSSMQPIRISVPADRAGDERYRHEGEEWLYVLSGTLTLSLGNESHTLQPGDAAYFDANIPHRLTAVNGRDVEAILVACASPRPLLESYF